MNKFTHSTKVKFNFEAELRGTNPGEIRKDKPYWYKVLVSKDIRKKQMKDGSFISLSSRFRRMEPTTSTNLDNLINGYKYFNKYLLIPAHVDKDFNMKPFPELGILKTKLKFINAWEIGIHDPERVVITEDDKPIIPANIDNAPILELLKENNNKARPHNNKYSAFGK